MAFIFGKSQHLIGLTFRDHSIQFTEVRAGKTPIVIHTGEHKLPEGIIEGGKIKEPETFKLIMGQCIDKWKLKGKRVLMTVPDALLVVRKIDLPEEIEDEELITYAKIELGVSVHIPIDNPVLDVKRSGLNSNVAFLFAAPVSEINLYVDTLKACKLKVEKVDVSALCIFRLFANSDLLEKDKNYMVLQLNEDMMSIAIFRKGELELVRFYPKASNSETKEDSLLGNDGPIEVEDIFQSTYYEVERLQNFFRYSLHNGEEELNNVIIAGDHQEIEKFQEDFLVNHNMNIISFTDSERFVHNHQEFAKTFYVNAGLCINEVIS